LRGSREKAACHQALFIPFLDDVRPKQAKWVAVLRVQQERDIPFELAPRFRFGRSLPSCSVYYVQSGLPPERI
jgi:hypothetical protein